MKTNISTDPKIISGLYGENEAWCITVPHVDKIEAYLESDNTPWFAIYKDGKIQQRVNSRYVESVVYSQPEQ